MQVELFKDDVRRSPLYGGSFLGQTEDDLNTPEERKAG